MQKKVTFLRLVLKAYFNGVFSYANSFCYSFFWYFAPKGQ